jgi:hypothetical protein
MKRVVAALLVAGALLLSAQTTPHSLVVHATRQAPTDLEVGGAIPGADQFISYQDLLQLPQVSFMASNDVNFSSAGTRLGGVALDQLRRLLGAGGDMVVAICKDGYRSNYTTPYLTAHHPVLVLTVNGDSPESWPKSAHGGDLGPYVIANPSFTPSFKVLSHDDEAQIPFQVMRLDFRNESEVFGPIEPRGTFAPGTPVMDGYRIAKQNCYRCHNMGAEGGRMASIPWPVVAAMAKSSPDFFARYVRNPQALNPHSRMAASPEYDDQTIAALRAYFETFAGEQK